MVSHRERFEVPIREVWQGTESCIEDCLAHGELWKGFGTKEWVQRRGRRKGEIYRATGSVVKALYAFRKENTAAKAGLSHSPCFLRGGLEAGRVNRGCAELPVLSALCRGAVRRHPRHHRLLLCAEWQSSLGLNSFHHNSLWIYFPTFPPDPFFLLDMKGALQQQAIQQRAITGLERRSSHPRSAEAFGCLVPGWLSKGHHKWAETSVLQKAGEHKKESRPELG